MKFKFNCILSGILLAISATGFTDDGGGGDDSTTNLTTYLQNLGQYFGYDVTQYCTTGGPCSNSGNNQSFSNTLLDQNTATVAQLNLFNSYLGALLGGTTGGSSTQSPMPFVTGAPGYSLINQLAGQTFTTPPYASASPLAVSASTIIDQQPYQSDPVSQAVLNLISTPNYTFCMDNNAQSFTANCTTLFREKIIADVIGQLQGTQVAFTPTYNQTFVSQLNTDTLISPLIYSTVPTNINNGVSPGSSGSPFGGSGTQNAGLTAETQAQQAANFIRYATSAINPLVLPTLSAYDNLVSQAQNLSQNVTPTAQYQALATLTNYLTKLRIYAAQSSVGISNLYYIFSKRLPQNLSGGGSQTSQALNEFVMASWRLYNPSVASGGQQWLAQINQGSAASVQKEIAILLAEINYQLYLTRQQQERLLLTNTMQLIQNAQVAQPDGSFSSSANPPASSASGSSS